MLFQEFLIESKLSSSSFQAHMYNTTRPGCFKPALISPGERNPSLRPQNYSCSFIHLDSIHQFEPGLVLRRALAEAFGGVNKRHTAALPALSIESQRADAQVERL